MRLGKVQGELADLLEVDLSGCLLLISQNLPVLVETACDAG